ncbi:MAG: delta-60 repeat domain-containing protein, partial [Phycisphaerae bacterium]
MEINNESEEGAMFHINKLPQALALLALCLFVLVLLPEVCLAQAGTLDPTFGDGGLVTTDFLGSSRDVGRDVVAIQADGKIVVVGQTSDAGGSDFAVARYNADGSLDASFDGDGKLTTDFAGAGDIANSVAIQADGKIVVAGRASISGPDFDFAVARYNADGSLDTSFDGDGKLTTDFAGSTDLALSVAIQADGKIVVAGQASTFGTGSFAVARYNADGTLDAGFDGDGKLTTDFAGRGEVAKSVAIQADGKIVAAGETFTDTGFVFALARYNADGSLDASFDGDGKLTTDFAGS